VSYLIQDAQNVKNQIRAFIAAHPELAEDDQFLADVLEGETDLHRVIDRALTERQEAAFMSEAIKSRVDALNERKARYDRKQESMKDLIKGLMLSAGLDKLPLPEATLTITKPRLHVEVDDVNELSQGFFKTERKADKKAIMEAFEAGFQVPGARVEKSDFSLVIRSR
jgi:hypothetical protein